MRGYVSKRHERIRPAGNQADADMASGTDTAMLYLVSSHWRMGGAVFCQPVRHEQVCLLQLDEDPLHRSRGEDARHNLRRVTARGAKFSVKG